eukprot:Skav211769  [mRNA]  locus=scaffold674:524049:557446:+ [translate_table: standard]
MAVGVYPARWHSVHLAQASGPPLRCEGLPLCVTMDDDDLEYTLLNKREVLVYQIPPASSSTGHKADDWKIAGKGKDLSIKLLEGGSGNLFAQCAIPGGDYASYVERVIDSSRLLDRAGYFVLKITNGDRYHGDLKNVIKLSQQLEMAKFKSFWKESESAEAPAPHGSLLDAAGLLRLRARMDPSVIIVNTATFESATIEPKGPNHMTLARHKACGAIEHWTTTRWIKKMDRRHAFIGLGFEEPVGLGGSSHGSRVNGIDKEQGDRNDAFDFNCTLADFKSTWIDREKEAETPAMASVPAKDWCC